MYVCYCSVYSCEQEDHNPCYCVYILMGWDRQKTSTICNVNLAVVLWKKATEQVSHEALWVKTILAKKIAAISPEGGVCPEFLRYHKACNVAGAD